MADERIREWARSLERADLAALARARRRFLERPSTKRLHALRTYARRLNSCYDDFRDVLACPKRKRLHRLIALTGEARDATVLYKLLSAATDVREAAPARALLRSLKKRRRAGCRAVYRALLRLKIV